jgi:cation transport ATPase
MSPAVDEGGSATAVLEASGMLRASEKAVVESAIGRQPGVRGVEANPVAKTATVTFDPAETSVEELQRWVEEWSATASTTPRRWPRPTSASRSAPAPTWPSRPPTSNWCAPTRWTSPPRSRSAASTLGKIRQNLGWAIGYDSIALPIAAGVFEPSLGLELRPEIAALSMSGSSFIVAVNALLLKRARLPAAGPPPDTGAPPGRAARIAGPAPAERAA